MTKGMQKVRMLLALGWKGSREVVKKKFAAIVGQVVQTGFLCFDSIANSGDLDNLISCVRFLVIKLIITLFGGAGQKVLHRVDYHTYAHIYTHTRSIPLSKTLFYFWLLNALQRSRSNVIFVRIFIFIFFPKVSCFICAIFFLLLYKVHRLI